MTSGTSTTTRDLSVNLPLIAGGTIAAFTLCLGWPFLLLAFVGQPAVIGGGFLLMCVFGYFAARWRSRILALLFFVPSVTPAACLFLFAIEPVYIPHIWEPSRFAAIVSHPEFDRTFEAAATNGEAWTTDPEAVARTYATTGNEAISAVRVWLRRDSDSTASAVALTTHPVGNYGNEIVTFQRIKLTRSGNLWRPTGVAYATRRRGDISWQDSF